MFDFVKSIPFVGDIVGDQFEKERRSDARLDAETEYLRQKEFAKHGIRWKVEDAKAAGLHPLYALGGGSSYTPSAISVGASGNLDYGAMGQDVSGASGAMLTKEEQIDRDLRRALVYKELEERDARTWLLHSQAAREQQEMLLRGGPMPTGDGPPGGQTSMDSGVMPGAIFDKIKVEPNSIPSARFDDFSTTAGNPPGFSEHVWENEPGRAPVYLMAPYSQEGPMEGLEGPLWAQASIILRNVRKYGAGWLRQFMFGGDPRGPTVSGRIRR